MFAPNPRASKLPEDSRVACGRPLRPQAHYPGRPGLSNRSTFWTRTSNLTICFQQSTNSFVQEKAPSRLLSINCALFRPRYKEQLYLLTVNILDYFPNWDEPHETRETKPRQSQRRIAYAIHYRTETAAGTSCRESERGPARSMEQSNCIAADLAVCEHDD
jgi:hypothetical protein